MKIEIGKKFIGNRNGREIQILNVNSASVTYRDLKYNTVFTVGRKLFEHCDIREAETV